MRDYALTALFLWGTTGMAVASHVHGRWLEDRRKVSTVTVYLIVLGLVAGSGMAVLGTAVVWNGDWMGLGASLPIGLLVGMLAWHSDVHLGRTLAPRTRTTPRRPVHVSRVRPIGMASGSRAAHRVAVNRWGARDRDAATQITLTRLLAGAMLEEIVYRGVLVQIAITEASRWATVPLLLIAVVAFGVSHLPFGWSQALAKLPLSILAMAATLATGTIVAAVIGHVLFNYRVWLHYRRAGTALVSGASQ
jgi:Type II CAAX prenyl endopeptidase Rce1-like